MKPIVVSLLTLLTSVILSVIIKCKVSEFAVDVIALTSIIFTSGMTFFNWRGLQAVKHKMLEIKNEQRKDGLIKTIKSRLDEINVAKKLLPHEYHSETCRLVNDLFKLDPVLATTHKDDFDAIGRTLEVKVVSERLRIILKGAE